MKEIKRLESEALFRGSEADEKQLHGLLKYRVPQHIKVKSKETPLDSIYRFERKEPILTEEEKEELA